MKDLGKTKFCLGLQIEYTKKWHIGTPIKLCRKGIEKIQYG
jgi:hypothetical protein